MGAGAGVDGGSGGVAAGSAEATFDGTGVGVASGFAAVMGRIGDAAVAPGFGVAEFSGFPASFRAARAMSARSVSESCFSLFQGAKQTSATIATTSAAPPITSGFFKERRLPSTGAFSGASKSGGTITRSFATSRRGTSAFGSGTGFARGKVMDSRLGAATRCGTGAGAGAAAGAGAVATGAAPVTAS